MKRWCIIDDATSKRSFLEISGMFTEKEAAIAAAEKEWNHMTAHDQRDRDAFFVGLYDVDEDGCVDIGTGAYEIAIEYR